MRWIGHLKVRNVLRLETRQQNMSIPETDQLCCSRFSAAPFPWPWEIEVSAVTNSFLTTHQTVQDGIMDGERTPYCRWCQPADRKQANVLVNLETFNKKKENKETERKYKENKMKKNNLLLKRHDPRVPCSAPNFSGGEKGWGQSYLVYTH